MSSHNEAGGAAPQDAQNQGWDNGNNGNQDGGYNYGNDGNNWGGNDGNNWGGNFFANGGFGTPQGDGGDGNGWQQNGADGNFAAQSPDANGNVVVQTPDGTTNPQNNAFCTPEGANAGGDQVNNFNGITPGANFGVTPGPHAGGPHVVLPQDPRPDEICTYQYRGKLYRMEGGDYKERGLGEAKILR